MFQLKNGAKLKCQRFMTAFQKTEISYYFGPRHGFISEKNLHLIYLINYSPIPKIYKKKSIKIETRCEFDDFVSRLEIKITKSLLNSPKMEITENFLDYFSKCLIFFLCRTINSC